MAISRSGTDAESLGGLIGGDSVTGADPAGCAQWPDHRVVRAGARPRVAFRRTCATCVTWTALPVFGEIRLRSGQITWAAIFSAVARTTGPRRLTSSLIAAGDQRIATLTAATASLERERTGAAIDRSALSSSSSLVAIPVRRTCSGSVPPSPPSPSLFRCVPARLDWSWRHDVPRRVVLRVRPRSRARSLIPSSGQACSTPATATCSASWTASSAP
jgi:hypothetical protein